MRPEKVYLEESIFIKDEEIGHTKEGLVYLIDHYETILTISSAKQLSDPHREHIKFMIKKYQRHIELYNL
jgi:hypothetical protein